MIDGSIKLRKKQQLMIGGEARALLAGVVGRNAGDLMVSQ